MREREREEAFLILCFLFCEKNFSSPQQESVLLEQLHDSSLAFLEQLHDCGEEEETTTRSQQKSEHSHPDISHSTERMKIFGVWREEKRNWERCFFFVRRSLLFCSSGTEYLFSRDVKKKEPKEGKKKEVLIVETKKEETKHSPFLLSILSIPFSILSL